jgi:hypothetical protein
MGVREEYAQSIAGKILKANRLITVLCWNWGRVRAKIESVKLNVIAAWATGAARKALRPGKCLPLHRNSKECGKALAEIYKNKPSKINDPANTSTTV